MNPKHLPKLFLAILIIVTDSLAFSYHNDYELLLTYKKYLKVITESPLGTIDSISYMLQTTNQDCMRRKLKIHDPGNIPDSEVERKIFSMSSVINGRPRAMKEAYAVMLAGPLCNDNLEEYFQILFDELLEILRNEEFEKNLECFKNYELWEIKLENSDKSDDDCTEVIGEFYKRYVLNSIDYVKYLIKNYEYPECLEDIAIKNAIYNYRAVFYANSSPLDYNYYSVRNYFVELMKNGNKEAFDCVMDDLTWRSGKRVHS